MTKLEYLNDTYLFESEWIIIDIRIKEDKTAIILDRTIFYPQWWWQPADHGQIIHDWNIFNVNDVRLDGNWIVWHFGEYENKEFEIWNVVNLKINQDKRIYNAKLHSAWHVIDSSLESLQLWIKAFKWFHFSDWPYVECHWTLENPEKYIQIIQNKINEILDKNLIFEKKEIDQKEALSHWISIPAWKSARLITIQWFPSRWCWWTHIQQTKDLGKIIITKISTKKWNTKISYKVEN